jgi:pimeloyl-ACP methyl ester carboxylesterase
MGKATANGIEIDYETFGSPEHPTMLLIQGLNSQQIVWDDHFCDQLAAEGFHVVRYDNRDVGLSAKTATPPDPSNPAYLVADMADDAAGLLDALGVAAVHVVGVSMGGMIAQSLAIAYPERVLSLCSIMSNTGDGVTGQPHPEAFAAMAQSPASDRANSIENGLAMWRVLWGPHFEFETERMRSRIEAAYDRCHHPIGTMHQMTAIANSPDRTPQLAELDVPTLVIHGDADPLVDVSGGRATADAVPNAKMLEIQGMGHELPKPLWDPIIEAIVNNTERAGDASARTA